MPVFLLTFWVFSLERRKRDLNAHYWHRISPLRDSLSDLARHADLVSLPFRLEMGGENQAALDILKRYKAKEEVVQDIWLVDKDYQSVLYGSTDMATDRLQTNALVYGGLSYFLFTEPLEGLFGDPVAYLVVSVNPLTFIIDEAWLSYFLSPASMVDKALPILASDYKLGILGPYLLLFGESAFNKGQAVQTALLPIFHVLLFVFVYLTLLIIVLRLPDILPKLRLSGSSGGGDRRGYRRIGGREQDEVLKRSINQLSQVINELRPRTGNEKDVLAAKSKTLSDAQKAKEAELYAKVQLPEGKKTALIKDPTEDFQKVYNYHFDGYFDDIGHLVSEEEPESETGGSGNKTALATGKDPVDRKIDFPAKYKEKFDEIPYE